eukprot:5427372-Prymnesium_polylepis.1
MRAAVEGLRNRVSSCPSEYGKRRGELRASGNQHGAFLQGDTPLECVNASTGKGAVGVSSLLGAIHVGRRANCTPQCHDQIGARCPEPDSPYGFAVALGSLFPGLCTD